SRERMVSSRMSPGATADTGRRKDEPITGIGPPLASAALVRLYDQLAWVSNKSGVRMASEYTARSECSSFGRNSNARRGEKFSPMVSAYSCEPPTVADHCGRNLYSKLANSCVVERSTTPL